MFGDHRRVGAGVIERRVLGSTVLLVVAAALAIANVIEWALLLVVANFIGSAANKLGCSS
jgi:hypothetical protein